MKYTLHRDTPVSVKITIHTEPDEVDEALGKSRPNARDVMADKLIQ